MDSVVFKVAYTVFLMNEIPFHKEHIELLVFKKHCVLKEHKQYSFNKNSVS